MHFAVPFADGAFRSPTTGGRWGCCHRLANVITICLRADGAIALRRRVAGFIGVNVISRGMR